MTLDANQDDDPIMSTIQQEYKILAEYKIIQFEKIRGVYVIPSYANSLLWFGVLFVRQGIYEGAVFRFSLILPDNFPYDKELPRIIFEQEVVHPHVCPFTNILDISHAFPEWQTGEDHIWMVLKYMQIIFSEPLNFVQNSSGVFINQDAAKLLLDNREKYKERIKQCIDEIAEHLYDPPNTDDPHYIVFDEFQENIHGPVLEQIRTNTKSEAIEGSTGAPPGLSWVKKGEYKPLSVK